MYVQCGQFASIVHVQLSIPFLCSLLAVFFFLVSFFSCFRVVAYIHFLHNSNCRDCCILRGADLFFQISFTINYRPNSLCGCEASYINSIRLDGFSLVYLLALEPTNQPTNKQIAIPVCIFGEWEFSQLYQIVWVNNCIHSLQFGHKISFFSFFSFCPTLSYCWRRRRRIALLRAEMRSRKSGPWKKKPTYWEQKWNRLCLSSAVARL